jgi:hypothetical protein
MQTTATVEQELEKVSAVYILSETPEAVVILINTQDKYPEVLGFNGCSLHLKDSPGKHAVVKFDNLPFEQPNMIYLADRHCLQVCIFTNKLLHALSFEGGGKCVFET